MLSFPPDREKRKSKAERIAGDSYKIRAPKSEPEAERRIYPPNSKAARISGDRYQRPRPSAPEKEGGKVRERVRERVPEYFEETEDDGYKQTKPTTKPNPIKSEYNEVGLDASVFVALKPSEKPRLSKLERLRRHMK